MNPGKQRTLAKEASLEGIGVHSGESATLTFLPAPPGTGLRFRRSDLADRPEVPADLRHVVSTELGTTLGVGEVKVRTVEHVLAALGCSGVDNAVLEISGAEVPIRDGSFRDFTDAIGEAGLVEQDADAMELNPASPVSVQGQGGESYVATPGDGLRISATIDFAHAAIGRQFGSFLLDREGFRTHIAPARTFGFRQDADALRARGLARGSTIDNTVVLDEKGVMNDGLRFEDEFLRHKVGDMAGDLVLVGARVNAHVVAERPSHDGNVKLARALAEQARRGGRVPVLDAAKLMEYLPHRYPMLLVDRILDFEEGRRIVGLKNVTINEPFFQGHYPGHPVMPGVLIVEAMAQVGGLLLMDSVEDSDHKVVYFMSLDKVKWRKPVVPGDTLVFELEMLQYRRNVCRMKGRGFVEDKLVAEAEFVARIMDR